MTALALLLAALAAGLFLMAPDGRPRMLSASSGEQMAPPRSSWQERQETGRPQSPSASSGGADGPTSIFLAGKVGGRRREEKIPAAVLDLEKAKKEAYGAAAELDWVSGGKISLHGSFGYLSFLLKANGKSELAAAFTLEEAGPIVVQGDRYTEVVGGRDSALVVTEPYKEDGDSRIFWYLEDGGTVEPLPEDMTNLFLEQKQLRRIPGCPPWQRSIGSRWRKNSGDPGEPSGIRPGGDPGNGQHYLRLSGSGRTGPGGSLVRDLV